MTNLYINYKPNGQWDKNSIGSQKSIIALVIALKKERANNVSNGGNGKGKEKDSGTKQMGLPVLCAKNVGNNFTCPNGDKWVWCRHHGCKKDDGTHQDMYMPEGHDHDAWKIKKDERKSAFKDKWKAIKAAAKRNAPEIKASSKNTKTKKSENTYALSESFVSALTTSVHLYEAEARALVDEILLIMADSIDDASK